MRFGLCNTAATLALVACLALPRSQARGASGGNEWEGPRRSVAYLPALDVEAGGGFANEAGGWGLLARVSTGVHRMTSTNVLTLGPEVARESGRYVMGMAGEWVHLRSGLGLNAAALRDITDERWGYRGAVVASYLRVGVSAYEGGGRAFMLSLRLPLSLLTAWSFGWL